jgi:molybdate transport system substrate-binding protein
MRRPVAVRSLVRVVALLAAVSLAACGGDRPTYASDRPGPTVFAAASLTDVLPEVAAAWRAEGGGEVRFSFGPTSKLVPQVIEGAPADAVVGADEAWMERLEGAGKCEKAARVILARNALVFVVPADAPTVPASAKDLPGAMKRIALAGENVPAGKYAKAALTSEGVWAAVEPRVVRGEDVRLTLRWVSGGDADGGVVYATDAKSDAKVRVAFAFPAASHPPIVYPAAPVKGSANAAEAARFLEFCRGPKGRPIFERRGFLPPLP